MKTIFEKQHMNFTRKGGSVLTVRKDGVSYEDAKKEKKPSQQEVPSPAHLPDPKKGINYHSGSYQGQSRRPRYTEPAFQCF